MLLELMINGEVKQTVEIDIESMTHGQRRRKFFELLGMSSDGQSVRFNLFNEGRKFFDVMT